MISGEKGSMTLSAMQKPWVLGRGGPGWHAGGWCHGTARGAARGTEVSGGRGHRGPASAGFTIWETWAGEGREDPGRFSHTRSGFPKERGPTAPHRRNSTPLWWSPRRRPPLDTPFHPPRSAWQPYGLHPHLNPCSVAAARAAFRVMGDVRRDPGGYRQRQQGSVPKTPQTFQPARFVPDAIVPAHPDRVQAESALESLIAGFQRTISWRNLPKFRRNAALCLVQAGGRSRPVLAGNKSRQRSQTQTANPPTQVPMEIPWACPRKSFSPESAPRRAIRGGNRGTPAARGTRPAPAGYRKGPATWPADPGETSKSAAEDPAELPQGSTSTAGRRRCDAPCRNPPRGRVEGK